MDKPQTPPPGAAIIELTDVVAPEEPAAAPGRKAAPDRDLSELDRILAELNAQTPPPAREDDLDKLMAEMGLPPQPRPPAPSREESELQDLLQELGGQEEQAGPEAGGEEGTGDPELDELLAQLGKPKQAPAPAQAEEAPALADPEDLAELVRDTVRQILEEEAPALVSRLVAQELENQLKSRVTQEVKDILKKAMTQAGKAPGKRDGGVVVD